MSRSLTDLMDWMDEQSRPSVLWYLKRLSGNDTLANKSHQAGPYIPKDILFDVFPSLNRQEVKNPDLWFSLTIDSHPDVRDVRAVWYNNKLHDNPKGGRNEARVTNLGGQESALLDPDSTGALVVFAFVKESDGQPGLCRVWVCDHETEEELIEERVGAVEPGRWMVWSVDHIDLFTQPRNPTNCWLSSEQMPPDWLIKFPTGTEIIRKTVDLRPELSIDVDSRLMLRRDCEFELFRSIEEAVELPLIKAGFDNVEDFIARAQTILQRRKARSGRSLELHIREIFIEERLQQGRDFAWQVTSEGNKKPDFLFPSAEAYQSPDFPSDNLRMLAVKTTCKDRWRQILNEAERIPVKHLFTLQEGVSENQFIEMTEAGVRLVVPKALHKSYADPIRPHLQEFESFLGDVRLLKERWSG